VSAVANVLHVVERYLDLSSGFVHGQISRSRHDSAVLSVQPIVNRTAFPLPEMAALPIPRLPARVARGLVLRHARQAGAELAHAHFGYALPYTRVLRRRAGLPVVVSLHGHDATAWAAANEWAYEPPPSLVDAVIVPSRWLGARARELGFAASQIRVIPSGVDTAFFRPTPLPSDPVVGFVGRLVEKKGIDTLMAAWPAVRNAVPDARLRVLGDGPLASLVVGEGVERVLPDAATRHEQVGALLGSARVVATPSQTAADGDAESLLLVNLEAQASGRPVVTTRHGGIPEFVSENASALLVAERSPDELAAALIRVLTDAGLATRLGSGGPAVAAEFDVAAMAARVDDLYDEVLASRST
jgi:glycosyltransferase involved in cell wall biosynthesis